MYMFGVTGIKTGGAKANERNTSYALLGHHRISRLEKPICGGVFTTARTDADGHSNAMDKSL